MHNHELAAVSGGGAYRRVEVVRVVNAPIQKVWNAITRADEVAEWWAAGQIDAREGGRIRLGLDTEDCGDEGLPLDGTIKIFQPPHIFEFTWNEGYDPAQGLVRFDLVELDGDRTQVTLVNLVPTKDVGAASTGWQEIIESLGGYVEG